MKRPVSKPQVVVVKRRGKIVTYAKKPKEAIAKPQYQERMAKEKIDPLQAASFVVPGFNRDKMTLGGQPVHVDAIMKLCNSTLKANGAPQIVHNPAWEV